MFRNIVIFGGEAKEKLNALTNISLLLDINFINRHFCGQFISLKLRAKAVIKRWKKMKMVTARDCSNLRDMLT